MLTISRNIIYTSLFNLIDYPAMVIPVNSCVDLALDPIDKDFKPANERDAHLQSLCIASSPSLDTYADILLSKTLQKNMKEHQSQCSLCVGGSEKRNASD